MKRWNWPLIIKVVAVVLLVFRVGIAALRFLRIPQGMYYSTSAYAPDFTWYLFFDSVSRYLFSSAILYSMGAVMGYLEKLCKARRLAPGKEERRADNHAGEPGNAPQMPVSDVEALFGTNSFTISQ